MNERFKQIAQEVFFDESTTGKPGQKMYMFGELKMQKFAELIVRECSKVIRQGGYRRGAFGNEDLRPSEIATMIEEHFEIEE